jgi:DNA-binding MarR family transcriptional regulator
MNSKMFEFSYRELSLLVTQFQKDKSVITNVHERLILYEAFHRQLHKHQPITIKWVEQTLKLSFPKVYSTIEGLVKKGYLTRQVSSADKRVKFLLPTQKALRGIKLFEEMKLNELNFLGLTSKLMKGVPRMSEFNETTKDRIQKDFLSPDWN